ncbi:hypothetical protein Poly51_41440 [Rubripirellula tenax]|uniref:Uncharacterized protein n=1 Tax=Rubripirellula tenax TaxID=2528015 RepID=A0A5C6EU26_9BACT|nr:hypothetical protein [Rubripirellula tenax]TWU50851.1 hypothetical protein Poly51_41440 [Rubripirellula tenax]
MTVSPNRPLDGNRHARSHADQHGSRPGHADQPEQSLDSESLALPPILFKLRDVSPPATTSRITSTAAPQTQKTAPPNQIQTSPNQNGALATESLATMGMNSVTDSARPAIETQPAADPYRATLPFRGDSAGSAKVAPELPNTTSGDAAMPKPERPTSDTRPAGRTWMEAAMAHRTVLVLLAAAIGFAFWTSRGSSDPSAIDSSLAKIDDALEIDTGELAVEIPTVDSAMVANAKAKAKELLPKPTEEDLSAAILAIESDAPPVAPTAPSVASLSPPQPSGNELSTPGFDPAMLSTKTLGASPVSSRTPNAMAGDIASGLPTLEDLESPANVNSGFSGTSLNGANPNVPVMSATPSAVSDWLRYLPPAHSGSPQ